jgi:integral membrane protein
MTSSPDRLRTDPIASRLRLVSILETLSFIVLLTMMFTDNEKGVSFAGAIHGLLFLGYAILVLRDREHFGWSWGFTALVILTGPIGAIIVLEKLRRR